MPRLKPTNRDKTPPQPRVAKAGEKDSFALDWIDQKLGPAEYRRQIVLFATLVAQQCGEHDLDPETLNNGIAAFSGFARSAAERNDAGYIETTSLGMIASWECLGADQAAQAISTSVELAQWTVPGLAVTSAIDAGTVIVNAASEQSCHDLKLVGTPVHNTMHMVAAAAPGSSVVHAYFKEFAVDVGGWTDTASLVDNTAHGAHHHDCNIKPAQQFSKCTHAGNHCRHRSQSSASSTAVCPFLAPPLGAAR